MSAVSVDPANSIGPLASGGVAPHDAAVAGALAWPAEASRGYTLGSGVGSVRVDPPVAMAPMADITDVLFHEVLLDVGGPGLYTAEMVSSNVVQGSASSFGNSACAAAWLKAPGSPWNAIFLDMNWDSTAKDAP